VEVELPVACATVENRAESAMGAPVLARRLEARGGPAEGRLLQLGWELAPTLPRAELDAQMPVRRPVALGVLAEDMHLQLEVELILKLLLAGLEAVLDKVGVELPQIVERRADSE
jgi:hypothetical protein